VNPVAPAGRDWVSNRTPGRSVASHISESRL
jgi:hypothetical protein